MKIFDKRPLSLILCITLGAFVFSSFFDSFITQILLISLSTLVFILTFIEPIRKFFSPILPRILSLCIIVSVVFSFVYFNLWFKAYNRYDGDVHIEGEIQDFDTSSYKTSILLKTDNIDGTPLSKYKLIVYVDKKDYYGFSIGTTVELVGSIESFGTSSSFDAESYYSSRGISGAVNEVKSFSIKEIGDYPFSYKVKDFRESLCRRIIINSNEDTGGLLCALLLGEKDYLPTGTKLDFSRIGISHILALSGMHLAILSAGFAKLLMFFRIGKKTSTLITIFFTALYMVLTGLSLSVMRAGFMLIVSSLLFLLGKSKDSMTSLFVSVTIICLVEPYAIFDTSLWLSAFATLGIVVMSEYQSEKYTKASLLKWLITSLLASFFAIAATFAITTLKFDGNSIFAPISTLVFSFLVEIFIYIGLILLIVGNFILIRYPFIFLGNFIIELSKLLSDFDWVYVSTNFTVVELLSITFTVLFFAFFILEIKRKKLVISILVGMLSAIFCLSGILTFAKQNETAITYHNIIDEHVLFTEDGETLAIDIASYSTASAYTLYADVSSNNLTKIDKYVLTHYSYSLEEAIITLSNSILIREMFIPTPQNKTEERIFNGISAFAKKADIKLTMYLNEDAIKIGKTLIIPLYSYKLGEQKKNMFTIIRGDKVYTYLNSAMLDGETKNMASEVIAGSHTIILGRHKSGNSISEFLQKFDNLEEIIFSESKINIDDETLIFYLENKTEIKLNPQKHFLYVK